jgi:uncharacterized protein YcbX
MIEVTRLFYYPIKSCRGVELTEARLGVRGIVGDRLFMVIGNSGMFISQRLSPRMAMIDADLDGDTLRLAGPDVEPFTLDSSVATDKRDVFIWRDTCDAVDQGDAVAEWLSTVLGFSCRLVKMADDYARRVDPSYAVTPADQLGFADGYPILLANEASLADLNSRMDVTLPMERFRPNVVVANAGPFEEDSWRDIQIGNVEATVVKPCVRCAITTTDQRTGERGTEPLRTLATFRRNESGGVTFAQNVIHSAPGVLRVGDEVVIRS